MKGYEKYLPDKQNKETVLIQAKIDAKLHANVKALLDKNDWSWHDTLTGLLAKLVDDAKRGWHGVLHS